MAAFEIEQSWLLFECVESDGEGLTDPYEICTNMHHVETGISQ